MLWHYFCTIFCVPSDKCSIITAMQAVNCWHPTTVPRILSQGGQCGMYGGQTGIQVGFCPSTSVFCIVLQMLHTHSYISHRYCMTFNDVRWYLNFGTWFMVSILLT